jgi:hypothetical protein
MLDKNNRLIKTKPAIKDQGKLISRVLLQQDKPFEA